MNFKWQISYFKYERKLTKINKNKNYLRLSCEQCRNELNMYCRSENVLDFD